MTVETLYPDPAEQDSARMLIARNLAFLENYVNEHAKKQIVIDNTKQVLRRLNRTERLTFDELEALDKTLRTLKSHNIPVSQK